MPSSKCNYCSSVFDRVKNQRYCSLACAFWSRVERRGDGECWPWTGAYSQGYGHFGFFKKDHQAHRVSLLLHGSDPGDGDAMHLCDNRWCCNPNHLKVGSRRDNMQDALLKGRMAIRDRHPMVKLTEAQVIEIRSLVKAGVPQRQVAESFGISQQHVSDISRGRRWSQDQASL